MTIPADGARLGGTRAKMRTAVRTVHNSIHQTRYRFIIETSTHANTGRSHSTS